MAEYLNFTASDKPEYCFLSYKKEDKEKICPIGPNLQFHAWYDYGIEMTKEWEMEIERHIKECSVFLLFMSKSVLVKNSFVQTEYKIAKHLHKPVFTVFLENITLDDVPLGSMIFFQNVLKDQCLLYRDDRSFDDFLQEINRWAKTLLNQSAEQDKHPLSQIRFDVHQLFYFNSGNITYNGVLFSHLLDFGRKICLYNHKTKQSEIRMTEDLNTIVTSFSPNREMMNRRLILTPNNKYLVYTVDNTVFTYDLPNSRWLNGSGKKLPVKFSKNENIRNSILSMNNDCVYIFTKIDSYYNQLILYDLEHSSVTGLWSLQTACISDILTSLTTQESKHVIITNKDDKLLDLVLEVKDSDHANIDIKSLDQQTLKSLLESCSDTNLRSSIDYAHKGNLSSDGLLYSVLSGNNIRVYDSFTQIKLFDFYNDAYFLAKGMVLYRYHSDGKLTKHTQAGSTTILDKTYFASNNISESIPHTFYYDERNNYYIFIGVVSERQNQVFVIDSSVSSIAKSEPFDVPFQADLCACVLANGILWISYSRYEVSRNSPMIFSIDYDKLLRSDS